MVLVDCDVCVEKITGNYLAFSDAKICVSCFERLFELAIENEQEHPAHWGTHKLDYKQWQHVISPELYQQYKAKTIEYECPPLERIYCAQTDPPRRPEHCGRFIGRYTEEGFCKKCDKCKWYTCLHCAETFSVDTSSAAEASAEHKCDSRRVPEVRLMPLQGLQRGRDYQVCPRQQCRRVWSIWDGCNHMKCSCGRYFCYICGISLTGNLRHFGRSGCPLYISGHNPVQPRRPDVRPGRVGQEERRQEIRPGRIAQEERLQDIRPGRIAQEERLQDIRPGRIAQDEPRRRRLRRGTDSSELEEWQHRMAEWMAARERNNPLGPDAAPDADHVGQLGRVAESITGEYGSESPDDALPNVHFGELPLVIMHRIPFVERRHHFCVVM